MGAKHTAVIRLLIGIFLALGGILLVAEMPATRPGAAGEGLAAGPISIKLVAVGDTLVHEPEVTGAWDRERKVYDFRPMFAAISPQLAGADLSVGVLETTLGGAELKYSGYPRFNSPDAVADALQWAGIDVAFTAHNHMLDMGIKGLFRTVDYLDRIGLAHVGSARSAAPEARLVVREVQGIKLAFLAYTDSTNGIPVPKGYEWAVNLYEQKKMAADVAKAREAGAEIVVCALHAGTEYLRAADARQKAIVGQMLAAGVDVVLGSHPHVIEPLETRQMPSPDGGSRTVFAAYSLGNVVSNQIKRYSDCGLMLSLTITKDPGQNAKLAGICWQPVWVHRYAQGEVYKYRILPIDANSAAVYADDPLLNAEDRRRMAEVWTETLALLGPKWAIGSGQGI